MRKFVWLILLLAAPALATQGVLPPAFAGWTAVPGSQAQSTTIEQFAGEDASLLRAAGINSAERQAYARGGEFLTVTLYRMHDPTSAYSAYSFLRPADATGAKPIAHSSISRQRALLLVGNFILNVSGKDLLPLAKDLKALAAQVAPHADQTVYPDLWQYLPVRDLVLRSDRYALDPAMLSRVLPLASGDWLGFSDGAEAELARYRINGQELLLVLVSYPTQQVAAKRLEELGQWFDLNPATPPGRGGPVLFARRKSSLLALVTGTMSPTVADSLLERIQYRTEVTWNEPSFKLTQPSMNQIVVGTIIGTGIILLFTLVASIAFGGFRLVIKHFLPGVVFDRSKSIEILQLGLTSKPIESKDFY